MRDNRSVPPCAVIPVLTYPSPQEAAECLEKVFGFTVRLRIANHRLRTWSRRAGEGSLSTFDLDARDRLS